MRAAGPRPGTNAVGHEGLGASTSARVDSGVEKGRKASKHDLLAAAAQEHGSPLYELCKKVQQVVRDNAPLLERVYKHYALTHVDPRSFEAPIAPHRKRELERLAKQGKGPRGRVHANADRASTRESEKGIVICQPRNISELRYELQQRKINKQGSTITELSNKVTGQRRRQASEDKVATKENMRN